MREFPFPATPRQNRGRAIERNGRPAVEFSWEGNDEMEHAFGRGQGVLADEQLEGMIFLHFGGEFHG